MNGFILLETIVVLGIIILISNAIVHQIKILIKKSNQIKKNELEIIQTINKIQTKFVSVEKSNLKKIKLCENNELGLNIYYLCE